MKILGQIELPNYQMHLKQSVEEGNRVLGSTVNPCNWYEDVGGVGVVDIRSEKGLIPIVAAENFQPYYADKMRDRVVEASPDRFTIIPEGRPDAVIDLTFGSVGGDFDAVVNAMPRASNKKRQFQKAKRDLSITNQVRLDLPWVESGRRLLKKYDDIDGTGLADFWFTMPAEWAPHFFWITVTHEQQLLGSGFFICNQSGNEWYWPGSVLDYTNPLTDSYSVGNVILLAGIEAAVTAGASRFNFGVDRFAYKPEMWGTRRQWTPGLMYKEQLC